MHTDARSVNGCAMKYWIEIIWHAFTGPYLFSTEPEIGRRWIPDDYTDKTQAEALHFIYYLKHLSVPMPTTPLSDKIPVWL